MSIIVSYIMTQFKENKPPSSFKLCFYMNTDLIRMLVNLYRNAKFVSLYQVWPFLQVVKDKRSGNIKTIQTAVKYPGSSTNPLSDLLYKAVPVSPFLLSAVAAHQNILALYCKKTICIGFAHVLLSWNRESQLLQKKINTWWRFWSPYIMCLFCFKGQ